MFIRILAIETSTDACSVAIWNHGEIVARSKLCPREHAKFVLPMVKQVMIDSGLQLHQFDVLAFGRGPGSFTGIRIGIGIAQGLALGADLPMLGISTLKTMAQSAWSLSREKRVLASIDARRGEIYLGQFEYEKDGRWSERQEERILTSEQLSDYTSSLPGKWFCVGAGWHKYPNLIDKSKLTISDKTIPFPKAEDMLPLALLDWQGGLAVAVENAVPTYLRDKINWKKLSNRL